ncbi:DEAD/DEAH box helicase [Candidatus Dojkabacteria bacterium]|nr:DEAD/DEAH box helicase [Candidatus Dojkabacteria bacterium]
MKEKKFKTKSWWSYFSKKPEYKIWVEKLYQSIILSLNNQKYPWVITKNTDLVALINESINKLYQKRIIAIQKKNGVNIDDIALLDLKDLDLLKKSDFINCGDDLSQILKTLERLSYVRVKQVWTEGEFSVIGDVMTINPVGSNKLYRLEFDFDKLNEIYQIDSETRRQLSTVSSVSLLNTSFPIHIRSDIYVGNKDLENTKFSDFFNIYLVESSNKKIKNDGSEASSCDIALYSEKPVIEDEINIPINLVHTDIGVPIWNETELRKYNDQKVEVIIVSSRNDDFFEHVKKNFPKVKIFHDNFDSGFFSKALNTVVYTDQEIWGTVNLKTNKTSSKYTNLILNEINPGDYVVHEDHGVGLYTGLKQFDESSDKYIELKYAQKDRLLIPLDQVNRITKYVGVNKNPPKLTRLSGGEWLRVKNKVTKDVEKLAIELLRIYAARELVKTEGLQFNDNILDDVAKDFEFVETDDQLSALADIKADLRSSKPMDRLIVGDVGFGKTEVALRTAYLIAYLGKQVAVLAPTTILVEQHYHLFKTRLEKFGLKVAALSRFVSSTESNEILKDIKNKKIDIVIGTHRLLSKDIEFNDLGLLVIDEEQKFGVSQKEKIKKFKINTHVLTMTATPIPRTLNMALSGVRDISLIATAPAGRKPIKNIVKHFNWADAEAAIRNEVDRNGQVYFLHNRVQSINHVRQILERKMPDIKFGVGHGQLSDSELSKVMRDFNEGRYDVLFCTTIIENGLDMPRVNTLIVDKAEMFGLSQLYQIRGRIGRSRRQAYAYFFYKGVADNRTVKDEKKLKVDDAIGFDDDDIWGVSSKGILWETARLRLDAIRSLEDLGSGFNLAQKDLEIRGSGSFLGKQQHGNVSAIGFSLYCRLLSEMVEKLKKKETTILG